MAETEQQPTEPTPEEMQQLTAVSAAGAQAKAEGGDPATAMKAERDKVGLVSLDDETIDKLAAKLNELNIESFREAGAFDPPPEPVRAPEQPQAPPPPPGSPPEEAHTPPPAPRKFAHRYLGYPG